MNKPSLTNISVVIPVYNELDNVQPLTEEILQALGKDSPYEIIIVDDGSDDGTNLRLAEIAHGIPQLRWIRHSRNYGQSAAMVTGIRAARHEWIVTLDGDGQNNPADIPTLIQALVNYPRANSFTLVVGNRKQRNDNWLRRVSSRIANSTRRLLLRDRCSDTGCSLKLFARATFLQLPHFNHLHRFIPALIQRAGGQVINVPVSHRQRLRGQSKYGVMNRVWVGIVDMFGVMWLIRRPCAPEIEDAL